MFFAGLWLSGRHAPSVGSGADFGRPYRPTWRRVWEWGLGRDSSMQDTLR